MVDLTIAYLAVSVVTSIGIGIYCWYYGANIEVGHVVAFTIAGTLWPVLLSVTAMVMIEDTKFWAFLSQPINLGPPAKWCRRAMGLVLIKGRGEVEKINKEL